MNRTISEHQVGCAGSGGGGGVSTTQQQTTTQSSPDSASSIGPFQSSILNRSNISLNDSGVGISPLTPRTNVFTFDSVEIDRHIRESIRESISSVESEQKDNKDVDGDAESDEEDAELARIVDSFASISSSSESSRLRPSAPINCEEDEADEEVPDYDDEENDDVFLSDDFEPSVSENKEEQARINNYLLTRTSRVEQRLSLQYGRRTNVVRNRLGGLQLSCQRFMHRIFGIGMPTPADSLGVATSSSSSFAIERDLIERMTISPANNELNFRVQESFNVNASTSSTNQTDQNRHEDDHAVQSQRNNSLPDVVPDSAVMAREIMRNMARKQRVSQRNICHRSASFAAPTSASVESARVASMENRRTMSVSFPIEQTSLTLVARQLREISIDFSAQQNQIIYIADNIRLDVLDELARKRSNLLEYHSKHPGNAQSQLATSCDSSRDAHSDPITFTTSESFLKVPHGWNGRKQGVLSLKFRTNQANGVLLYASGVTAKSETSQASNVTSADYFAMELLDGHLYMLLFLGSTPIKIPASNRRVDDSKWHSIQVNRIDRKGEIILDDSVPVSFLSAGSSQHLDLANEIYLGGVSRFSTTPPELWSAGLGNGFVGCVRDLLIDQLPVDIGSLARAQDSGSIKPGCHAVGTATCAQNANVCLNGGFCTQSWNRVQCNCGSTAFTGSVCSKDATIYSFNGEQYFQVAMAKEMKSQAESLSFRFRTDKSDGLLFTTTHHRAPHQLSAYLKRGSVSVNINFGDRLHENIVQIGHNLNDDQWHTIQIERRGQNVHVELDNTDRKQTQLTSGHFTLLYDTLHLGSRMFIGKVHSHQHHIASFVGYMQNFIMNGHLYFELARDGQLTTGSTRITAKLGRKDRVLSDVATFKSKFTYVALPQLRAYSSLSVHFQFKTRDANALLFFNGGSGRDFVALELVNGRLHFIFDLGDGARRIQSKSSNPPLNDNRWHSVTLGRPWLYEHTMLVDDEQHSSQLSPVSGSSNTPVNLHLDLDGLLFVGGVREEMWSTLPRSIKARSGFEGCIASLELNGESVSLTGSQVLVASTLVEQGCSAPVTRCSSTACANRGVCVQLWNSYTCDCDLTSFSGPTCQDGTESTAFQFGPSNPGLITFAFDENNRPDTRNDLLALGFLTSVPNAVLVRVDSATTADYLQLEIADGNMLVVYNLGTEDIDIGDLDVKVNDGQYHIVRFTRTGQNSTLQIDNHNIISRTPAGAKQMNIFNAHAKIQLGGRKNVIRNTIEKSFTGIMAGLVFNGHRLLDIAAEDDARIKIEGEIEAMVSIRNNSTESNNAYATPSSELAPETNEQMQSEPKSTQHHPPATQHNSQNSNDDLIYSGAGSGCYDTNAGNDDDEENAEQCAHLHQDGSGDDLITPVYVAVNRLRPTRPSTNWNNNNNNGRNNGNNRLCNDDDEDEDDCVDGSGSSPYDSDSGYSDNDRNYDNNNNNNRNNYSDNYHQPSYGSSYTTWQPPTVPPMSRPPYSNNYQPPLSPFNTIPPFYYGGASNAEEQERILSSLRPKTTAPSWTKPIYSVAGPAKPPPMVVRENSQDPPEIYEVPLNIPEPSNDTDQSQNQNLPPPPEVLHRASNDRTVMIIGMIAICLIVVVIIAPIVLFFKVRLQAPDPAYKIETMFGAPKFGTLPIQPGAAYPGVMPVSRAQSISGMNAAAAAMQMQQAMVMAGQMGPQMGTNGRMQSRPPTRPGTPTHVDSMAMKKKDPHEWYV